MKSRRLIGLLFLLGVAAVAVAVTFRVVRHEEKRDETIIVPGRLPSKTFHRSARDFNRFAVETYLETVRDRPGENAVFSPLCLSNTLEILLTAARGDAVTEIRKLLHLSASNETVPKHRPLFDYVPPPRAKTAMRQNINCPPFFLAAQSVWLADSLKIDPGFLKRNRRDYALESFSVDFRKSTLRDEMNVWASKKTQGLIPAAAPPLQGDEQVVFLGTLYFKALWENMFETNYVGMGEFTLATGETVRTPMMNSELFRLPHTEDEDCLVLELPYKHSTYSMVFLLPRTPQGIDELERKLDADRLDALLKTLTVGETEITIPKFRIEQEHDLRAILPEAVDLSGMFASPAAPLAATEAIQKVVLGIDEYGTEAASTFFMAYVGIGGGKFVFKAKHPFLFLIRDRTSGTIFFIGKLMNPETAKPREFTVEKWPSP